jgi:type VI secretion system protein ImpF
VLDRLLDDEPGNTREVPKRRDQIMRDLKQSVCRDLEDLLNTRHRCGVLPEDLEELDVSLVNYGISEIAGAAGAIHSTDLPKTIERVIKRFETRFKSVKVTLLENKNEYDRTVRFRIDAVMYAEPAPEPITFDSQLEPTTSVFKVKTP